MRSKSCFRSTAVAKVLLGVTGSVAAIYTPELFAELRGAGHDVKVVATRASLYFFDPVPLAESLVRDEDEWPAERYRRGDPVLHIELRRWADLLLVAPLDAHTLARFALGLADNALTCVWRAWDRTRPVVLVPAMNTLMWEHPATLRHLRQVAEDLGTAAPAGLALADLIAWINQQAALLRVVPPITKRLACDDIGIGAMAERGSILEMVKAIHLGG
jgi:phosphopantothenoylcysteine decarboxylase